MKLKRIALLLLLGSITVAGCQSEGESTIDGTPFLLTSEPEGAQEVIAARESAADGDDVLVVGRIGGGANPWIEDRAAFKIVDNSPGRGHRLAGGVSSRQDDGL